MKPILHSLIFIGIICFLGCQDKVFGDYPATYHFDGIERIDSQMYVSEGFNEFLIPLEVEGSIKDSLSNYTPSLKGSFRFDKIRFESSDSMYFLAMDGHERTKHYVYDGVEKITLSNTVDFYEKFLFDEQAKILRHPLAVIFKSRFNSTNQTVETKGLVLSRGFGSMEEVAQFGAFGDLFYEKNDSMGILFYDLVFKME